MLELEENAKLPIAWIEYPREVVYTVTITISPVRINKLFRLHPMPHVVPAKLVKRSVAAPGRKVKVEVVIANADDRQLLVM